MKKILLLTAIASMFAATSAFAHCGSCEAGEKAECKAECKKECCAKKKDCAKECKKECCAKKESKDETAAAATKEGACCAAKAAKPA
jgi:hypothetical protein